ncbi:MAG: hypothetical protein C4562_06255 [Actinobacteria bacterium]|nr:MAG: hypothetical protein C4562_06255 [Actinomycetota bacterium]
MKKQLEFSEIASLGRTFSEYCRLFALDNKVLEGNTILDVASGCSSFCAEARAKGYDITASDPIYDFEPSQIRERFEMQLNSAMEQLPKVAHLYTWKDNKNVDDFRAQRQKAFDKFFDDYQANRQRYLATSFPKNDLKDKQFEICLASHFLFIWDDKLDYQFHLDTILELVRITNKEIRLFPLVSMNGTRSAFLEPLITDLESGELSTEIQTVDYEVIKGGNEMLRIRL